jgi:hypothetical protein
MSEPAHGSLMLKMGGAGKDGVSSPFGVIPAKAGIQGHASAACRSPLDPGFRRGDGKGIVAGATT